MERQNKKRSRNDHRHKATQNTSEHDHLLNKTIKIIITYGIIILTILIITLLTGCTNQALEQCIQTNQNNTQKYYQLQKQLQQCQQEPPIIEIREKTIYNCTTAYENKTKIMKYSIALEWCEHRLNQINNTNYCSQLARNNTLLKYKYETCNETLTQIGELYEEWS